MVKKTPEQIVSAWGRKMRAATEDMRIGAEAISEAPSSAAIKKKEKLKAELIAAIDSGIWEKQLGKVTLDDWRRAFIETGIPRVSGGVDKAEPKMRDFAAWLVTAVSDAENKVAKMPDLGLEDRIARMTTFVREMAKKKYKGR